MRRTIAESGARAAGVGAVRPVSLLLSLLLVTAAVTGADAATIYASSVGTVTTDTSVTVLKPQWATGSPDSKRMRIRQSGTPSPGRARVPFVFQMFSGTATGNTITVVVDQTVRGTVTARVVAVTGGTVSSSTTATITGGSGQNQQYTITYALSSAANLTGVTVEFSLSGGSNFAQVEVDTVYVTGTAVPEPSTWILFGAGLLGLTVWRGRRRSGRRA